MLGDACPGFAGDEFGRWLANDFLGGVSGDRTGGIVDKEDGGIAISVAEYGQADAGNIRGRAAIPRQRGRPGRGPAAA